MEKIERDNFVIAPGTAAMRALGAGGKAALLGLSCLAILALAAARELALGAASSAVLLAYAAAGLAIGYLMLAFYVDTRRAMGTLQAMVQSLRQGDLTDRSRVPGRGEFARIGESLEGVNTTLSAMVAGVRSDAVVVAQAGKSLASAAGELATRTERQAATLEQTSAGVQELSDTVRRNADDAASVEKLAARVRGVADSGGERMRTAVDAVRAIKGSTARVHDIIGVIEGIAFQTNVLALNAAVEAARAGDHGRGFAVVASEVRALALRSSNAAQEVRSLIATSTGQVESGVRHIDEVSAMLGEIVGGVAELASGLQSITGAAMQQSAALLQMTQAVGSLDEITQQNSHMVERAAADSAHLGRRAERLAQTVGGFRLRQGTADEAFALVQAAQARYQKGGRAALADITDAKSGFCDRDMYVFAWDRQLVYHAFAGKPANVGKSAAQILGTDVSALMRDVWEAAAAGGGWVDYDFFNPTSGKVAPKTSYVVGVSDDLVLGCGVYKTVQAA